MQQRGATTMRPAALCGYPQGLPHDLNVNGTTAPGSGLAPGRQPIGAA